MPSCIICGNPCLKKTCSEKCRATHNNNIRRVKRRVERAEARMKRAKLVCEICQQEYIPVAGHNRKTCGATACQEEYRRRYDIDRSGRVAREFDCPVCKKHIVTYRRSQVTCGSDTCYNVHHGRVNAVDLKLKRQLRDGWGMPINPMDCPWESGKLDTLPQGVASWDDPIMDPLGCGTAMVMLDVELKMERRAA